MHINCCLLCVHIQQMEGEALSLRRVSKKKGQVIPKEEVLRRLRVAQGLVKKHGQTPHFEEPGLTVATAIMLAAVPPSVRDNIARLLSEPHGENPDNLDLEYRRHCYAAGVMECYAEVDDAMCALLGRRYRRTALSTRNRTGLADAIAKLEKKR